MTTLFAISWAGAMLFAALLIYMTWGNIMLVQMFPEGQRWWMPWSRLASITVFAAIVLVHPFNAGWL